MLTSLAYYYYSHRQSNDHKIMNFDNRSHSLSTGWQVRGRVIVPVRSVALSYMPYKKTLSLRIFLRQDAHSVRVFFLRQADSLGPFYTELAPATSMLQYGNTDVCFFKYYYYTGVELRKCCCTSDLTKRNIIRRH